MRWHHKPWTVTKIPSNADINGHLGIVRPNWSHQRLLAYHSIPDGHCYSDRPWLSWDGQPKGTPVIVSLTTTETLTIPDCGGMVSKRSSLLEYLCPSLVVPGRSAKGHPISHCNSDCPWLSQDSQPQALLSDYL